MLVRQPANQTDQVHLRRWQVSQGEIRDSVGTAIRIASYPLPGIAVSSTDHSVAP